MTEERLRELEKLHNASYQGEWTYDAQDMFVCHEHLGDQGLFMIATCDKDDGEAIAAAHNAMPDLLAEIRRLQRENARLRPVFEAAVAVRVDADYPWYDGWKNYLPPMLKASLPDLCDAVDAAKAKDE